MSSLSLNASVNALSSQRQRKQSSNNNNVSNKLEGVASNLDVDEGQSKSSEVSISGKSTARSRGGSQQLQTLQESLSEVQTAESSVETIQGFMEEGREVVAQATEDDLSDTERENLTEELQSLSEEIDSVVSDTDFNNDSIFEGEFDVGAGEEEDVSLSPPDLNNLSSEDLGLNQLDLSTQRSAEQALEVVNGAINQVSTQEEALSSAGESIKTAVDSNMIRNANEDAASSRLRDADIARETTENAQSSILSEAGTSALAQAENLEVTNALQLLN